MNLQTEIAEARASALALRASARACSREQGALKFRLMRAAESLDVVVGIAVRALDRIEEPETSTFCGSECAHGARCNSRQAAQCRRARR